jgi:tRNA(Ile)-lysidine synthase
MSAEEVREAVRAGGLLGQDRPVVVMLSGGRDSVCLLDVAVVLCEPGDVSALHVNYGLREQAGADERHCVALCEEIGVELEVVRERRAPPAQPPTADGQAGGATGNLQAWAREVRYRAAERMAKEKDALIATGHTASDQVETILYRLAASPGRRALQGMVASEGRLIRPLLAVTRGQTGAYCEARGLQWREDESNDSERFARARVRHGLVAALRAVHPAAEANVLRTAWLLREETELLDGLVANELAGRQSIAIARLEAMPAALARLVVVRLAEDATGTYVPQAGDRVGELLALARRGGRAELHVGGQAGALIEGGVLQMRRLPPREG